MLAVIESRLRTESVFSVVLCGSTPTYVISAIGSLLSATSQTIRRLLHTCYPALSHLHVDRYTTLCMDKTQNKCAVSGKGPAVDVDPA